MGMQLIETIEVGSGGAASIEFTSIPQNGVDLLCVFSTRSDTTGSAEIVRFRLNGDSSSAYNYLYLRGNGSSVYTSSSSSQSEGFPAYQPKSTDTANTFNNGQIYISNYTSTTNKSISTDAVEESNATEAFQLLTAQTYSTSSSISSMLIFPLSGNFVQYSTASLYKIS